MTVDQRITGYCKANQVEPNGVEQQRVETNPAISQSVQTCCECLELLYCVCVSEHECVHFSSSICLSIILALFPQFFFFRKLAAYFKSSKVLQNSPYIISSLFYV